MPRNVSIIGLALTAVLTMPFVVVGQSTDPWLGIWKLDVARSKFNLEPAPKSRTVTLESVARGAQKHTFDDTLDNGRTTHREEVTTYDGKDVVAVPRSEDGSTNSFRRVDARTYEVTSKIPGQAVRRYSVVVSADGKTLTTTATIKNRQGKAVTDVAVYNKQ
jgi:hypothetical protein